MKRLEHLTIGQIFREMQRIAHDNNYVYVHEEGEVDKVLEPLRESFVKYYELSRILDKKETEYNSYKPAPRFR